MKLSKNEALLINVLAGIFCAFLAACLELDPIEYFFFGVTVMYLNWQVHDSLLTWWRKTPPFLGWRYWIETVMEQKPEKETTE